MPAPAATEPAKAEAPVAVKTAEFPTLKLPAVDGTVYDLAAHRGRWVVVNFWATWCGPCREEMPDFAAIYQQRQADGFVVLAVNAFEPPEEVAAFVDEFALTFPVILDESGTINTEIYGAAVEGYPTSLLIDRDGVIVQRFPGIVETPELLRALDTLTTG